MKKLLIAILLISLLFLPTIPAISFAEVKPPRFDVINIRLDPSSPGPDEEFGAYFTIRNYGNVTATDIIVEFNGMDNFEAVGLTNRKFVSSFTPTSSNYVSFNIKGVKGRKDNKISLSFSYNYEYPDKDDDLQVITGSGSQQVTVSLPLPDIESDDRPNFSVTNVTLEPSAPKPNDFFNATIFLENLSSAEARNINIEIDGQDNFEIVDITNRKHLPALKKGTANTLVFRLKNKENRKNNSIKLNFSYYYGAKTEAEQQTLTVNLPLNISDNKTGPQLKIKSFSLSPRGSGEENLLRITLENLGQEQAENIYVTLDGGSNIHIIQDSNLIVIPQLNGGKEVTIERMLGINPDQGKKYYPLNIKLDYKDRSGNSYDSTETLGISSSSLGSEAAATPRVLISKYTLSDEKILAGNVVTLTLFIENTHSRPVHNTKVSFKVFEVEDKTGSTVFSPVNSSNSFFIEQIPARTTVEKSIDFLVDPNAAAQTYIIPVAIEYEDESANSYTVDELVNIPVTQECKLQVINLELPPVANIGQPAFVGAEFVNVGKAVLNNFIVMMEGNFPKEQASYYVGNLEIGASDFYQGIIYPESEGLLTGTLIFSYIDNNNKEVRVEEPFEINVEPMRPMEPFPGEDFPGKDMPGGPGGRPSGSKSILLFLLLPVAVALVVGIFLWRRKIKKKNEEFLDA